MRYFFYLLIFSASLTYCTTVESVTENGEESAGAEASEERFAPDWFDNRISSSSDSTTFYGYAHAADSDSADAAELAAETAIENLRFEIDRFAEDIRKKAVETTGSDQYQTGGFIFTLRTAVQELDLSGADLSHGHNLSEDVVGVHHHFIRAEMSREDVNTLLSSAINNNAFNQELESFVADK